MKKRITAIASVIAVLCVLSGCSSAEEQASVNIIDAGDLSVSPEKSSSVTQSASQSTSSSSQSTSSDPAPESSAGSAGSSTEKDPPESSGGSASYVPPAPSSSVSSSVSTIPDPPFSSSFETPSSSSSASSSAFSSSSSEYSSTSSSTSSSSSSSSSSSTSSSSASSEPPKSDLPEEPPEDPPEGELTPIMGRSVATVDQMRRFILKMNPDVEESVLEMLPYYLSEGEAEGVRGDIAFAQSCLETGYFLFEKTGTGSAVTIDQNNFCGMGVIALGVKGESFETPQLGIRAQIQHLKAYGSTLPLNGERVDNRFAYVTRGCAEYVEWLGIQENPSGKGWAGGKNYGYAILNIYRNILSS